MQVKKIAEPFAMLGGYGKHKSYRRLVQTTYPYLVGHVFTFAPTPIGERNRLKFLSKNTQPLLLGKADGYRAYITITGTLADEELPQHILREHGPHVARDMANFFAKYHLLPRAQFEDNHNLIPAAPAEQEDADTDSAEGDNH